MSKQIQENPKIDICAVKGGVRRRVAGKAYADDRIEAQEHMLAAYPSLQGMYKPGDGNTEVFCLKEGIATFSSFTAAPEVIQF